MTNLKRAFHKYMVPADSVSDFLDHYYKTDRYTGRGSEYATSLLKSYEKEYETRGYCFISHHDSKTGEIVAYYGKPPVCYLKPKMSEEEMIEFWSKQNTSYKPVGASDVKLRKGK